MKLHSIVLLLGETFKLHPISAGVGLLCVVGLIFSLGGVVGQKISDVRFSNELSQKDSQIQTKNIQIRGKDEQLRRNAEDLRAAQDALDTARNELIAIRDEGVRRDNISRSARKDYHDAKAGHNVPHTTAERDALLCELYPEECR